MYSDQALAFRIFITTQARQHRLLIFMQIRCDNGCGHCLDLTFLILVIRKVKSSSVVSFLHILLKINSSNCTL